MFDVTSIFKDAIKHETVLTHRTKLFGRVVFSVDIKAGNDANKNGKHDVAVKVTAAGAVILDDVIDLPESDRNNAEKVFARVIEEIEKRGIDIPGVGKGL